jgi:predicted transposase YbfD/YdcC
LAVDGKTSRGARRPDGSQVHLFSAVTHGPGLAVGQVEVDAKTNETRVFRTLLRPMALTGVTVTFDALLTVRAHLDWLVTTKAAHYIAVVKRNQPTLYRRLTGLAWAEIPTVFTERDHGHGRDETRSLTVATVGFLDFPHAVQAIRIIRWRRVKGQKASQETRYAITTHTAETASPEALATYIRGQWTIENSSHHVRDVSFREDASTLRTRNLPANIAAIRSAVINRLRQTGYPFIPEGRRNHTRPTEALDLHGFP